MKIGFPSFKISWGRIPQTAFKVGASDARLWAPPFLPIQNTLGRP